VPGEGAGALVLETRASAERRGAAIKAYIDGIGIYASADTVFSHSASHDAIARSTTAALQQATTDMAHVDWVSSAANGTSGLDAAEANAWQALLDPQQHRVVAFKDGLGEFSASGVLRLALGVHCLERDDIPLRLPADPIDAIAGFNPPHCTNSAGSRFLHQGLGLGGNSVSITVAAPGAQHAN
jgi:3-oxoacyl-[acyl-carrier-protein] synthase II